MEILFPLQIFTRNLKKIEVPLTILRRKRILNKHLCKNFFYENRIPVFLRIFECRKRRRMNKVIKFHVMRLLMKPRY